MSKVPSKVAERIKESVKKYSKILEQQKSKDINESDTVTVIVDMLSDIFGYDRYADITKEYAVKSTFCDLAVKHDNSVAYLIECKAIGVDLKETHMRQALEYSTNVGIEWAILTNGQLWKVYKVKYEKPIKAEEVFSLDFINCSTKDQDFIERVFVLTKETLTKRVLEDLYEQTQIINKFVLSALMMSDETIDFIRRRLRDISKQIKVENEAIRNIIINDMIKREILENPELQTATKKVSRVFKKINADKQKSCGSPSANTAECTSEKESINAEQKT